MSMKLCSIIILFFGLFWEEGRAQDALTACKDLPKVSANYSMMVSGSPYHAYRTSDPTYNCSTAILTGPAPLEGTNYTLVVLQNNTLKASLNVYPKDPDMKTMVMTCDLGSPYEYTFWAQTLEYTIAYICAPDLKNVMLLRVYAHTDEDAQEADAIIQQKKFTLSAGSISNARDNCPPAPYCQGYNF